MAALELKNTKESEENMDVNLMAQLHMEMQRMRREDQERQEHPLAVLQSFIFHLVIRKEAKAEKPVVIPQFTSFDRTLARLLKDFLKFFHLVT